MVVSKFVIPAYAKTSDENVLSWPTFVTTTKPMLSALFIAVSSSRQL